MNIIPYFFTSTGTSYVSSCGYYLGSDNEPFVIVGEGAVVVS